MHANRMHLVAHFEIQNLNDHDDHRPLKRSMQVLLNAEVLWFAGLEVRIYISNNEVPQ